MGLMVTIQKVYVLSKNVAQIDSLLRYQNDHKLSLPFVS